MSIIAIEQALSDLQSLPEPEQEIVLDLLQSLKRRHAAPSSTAAHPGDSPALTLRNGRLVFSGHLEAPHIDWVRVSREERENEIMAQVLGRPSGQ